MAKLVNKPQAIREGVRNPTSSYSRIIGCGVSLGALPGGTHCVCRSAADKLWLLQVKVWASFRPTDPVQSVRFKVKSGLAAAGEPIWQEVRDWEDVIPLTADLPWWRSYAYEWAFSWDMKRHYEGGTRRFGLYVEDGGGTLGWIYSSFEISEG